MDSQNDQNQTGITYLNSRRWYRVLKVLYSLVLGGTIGFTIPAGLILGWPSLILIAPIAVLLLFEIVRRAIYYTVTGKAFPNH